RRELAGWDATGFDDHAWSAVKVASYPLENLIAYEGPPVRRPQGLRPGAIITSSSGPPIVDMGQNMVGWVRLKVQGPAGTSVTLAHEGVLDQDSVLSHTH